MSLSLPFCQLGKIFASWEKPVDDKYMELCLTAQAGCGPVAVWDHAELGRSGKGPGGGVEDEPLFLFPCGLGQYQGTLPTTLWLLTLAGLLKRVAAGAERRKGHRSGQGGQVR